MWLNASCYGYLLDYVMKLFNLVYECLFWRRRWVEWWLNGIEVLLFFINDDWGEDRRSIFVVCRLWLVWMKWVNCSEFWVWNSEEFVRANKESARANCHLWAFARTKGYPFERTRFCLITLSSVEDVMLVARVTNVLWAVRSSEPEMNLSGYFLDRNSIFFF